jgi:DNA-binding NarL/FixJ family response regulator
LGGYGRRRGPELTWQYVDAAQLLADVRGTANDLRSRPLAGQVEELARAVRGRHSEAESWHPLTAREFQVARLIATGLTNAQIAAELSVAPRTVSAHVEHVLAKLGASRRTEIASWVATTERATGATGRWDKPVPTGLGRPPPA